MLLFRVGHVRYYVGAHSAKKLSFGSWSASGALDVVWQYWSARHASGSWRADLCFGDIYTAGQFLSSLPKASTNLMLRRRPELPVLQRVHRRARDQGAVLRHLSINVVELLAIFSWWGRKHGSNDGRAKIQIFIIKKASCLRHQYVLDFMGVPSYNTSRSLRIRARVNKQQFVLQRQGRRYVGVGGF